MNEKEKIKDLKAVYSGAVQAKKIEMANIIKGGIDLIEKLQKENEELKIVKSAIQTLQINSIKDEKYIVISKNSFLDGSYKHLLDEYIPVQKIREKIEEMQKEYNKLDEEVDRYINDVNKDSTKFYKNRERISTMQELSYFINILKELIEGRK